MRLLSCRNLIFNVSKRFASVIKPTTKPTMKYLNVAEKNDAAKNISAILSRGASNRREGLSVYNKIYEFQATVFGEPCEMVMTSVSGHLLNYEFTLNFRNWNSCNPVALFDAPIQKCCSKNYEPIKRTLEREIRSCQGLIIWTDCDREGENIGFEIIKVCTDVRPNIQLYRAKFSEITGASIFRALNALEQPNKNISDAVDVRQEMDLRTGAAFTRLQTLRFQRVFPQKLADRLVSYGSCQFPTLGFVVERYQAIEDFIAEPFWRIKMNHRVKQITTDFGWQRDRLFDKNAVEAILDICKENPLATIEKIVSKPKSKWRPFPLDTVEMEKTVSKKLKITAKDTMKIAEKLYTQGLISYPRTETNIFPKELNLTPLVTSQCIDETWGAFAQRIIDGGGPNPRQGRKSDAAHPPIHPLKHADNLQGNEKRVYEYIVRHFLACVQKDAEGYETIVTADIQGEKFIAKGLIILEKNYLDVYIYEKWNAKEINHYEEGDTFTPTVLELVESRTAAPKLLTEADLIALMDKHGIGTDATHADHIDTIKSREYVGLHEDIYFVPGTLGMGLVEGYNSIGLDVGLAKPILRSEFENDLKLICDGLKNPDVVLREQIAKYRAVFEAVVERMEAIDRTLANRLEDVARRIDPGVFNQNANVCVLKCPKCGNDMFVRDKKNGQGKYICCGGFPECKNAIWLPLEVQSVEVLDQICETCGPDVHKLKMKFTPNLFPGEPNPNTLCIGGCDNLVLDTLDISKGSVRRINGVLNNRPTQNGNNTTINNPNRTVLNQTVLTQNPRNNTTINNSNRTMLNPAPNARNNTTLNRTVVNQAQPRAIPAPNSSQNRPTMPTPSTSRTPFRSNGGDDEQIVCACNVKALQLTVRKEGPNTGRKFYKCASQSCDFFAWATEGGADATPGPSRTQQNDAFNNQNNDIVCQCNLPAVRRIVNKEGPNKGRPFYCCSKPMGQGCKFYKWGDEDGGDGGGGGSDDFGGGGGGGKWNGKMSRKGEGRAAPYGNNGGAKPRAKRKCGKCGQEGHTKPKCPN